MNKTQRMKAAIAEANAKQVNAGVGKRAEEITILDLPKIQEVAAAMNAATPEEVGEILKKAGWEERTLRAPTEAEVAKVLAHFNAQGDIVIPATEIADQKTPMYVGLAETEPKKPAKKHWGDQRLPMEKADEGRLPDGSKFVATYNAEKKRWFGNLMIYPDKSEPVLFQDDSSAVMKLLKKLDAQYRAWLKLNEVKPS